jgi:hypothetical protein
VSAPGVTLTKQGAGTVATRNVAALGLNVSGGTVRVLPNGGAAGVSRVDQLNIADGARFDLNDNKLVTKNPVGTVTGAIYDGVSRLIQLGRNTGNWSGATGIVTSQSNATNGSNYTSIGVATAAQVLPNTATETALWAGQTVTGTDTLVMYTYGGDANLDGKINIDDYGHIDTSIGIGLTGWFNGDFNYDGIINIDDYGIIDVNIGIQGAPFSTASQSLASFADQPAATAVPEPASLSILAFIAAGTMPRRRRSAIG